MAGPAFPSWAYNNAGQASQVVASQAAFNALTPPGSWSLTPFPPSPPSNVPFDPTPSYPVTDTRLQQMLIEARILNMMFAHAFAIPDDLQTTLRPDVLANDSGLST